MAPGSGVETEAGLSLSVDQELLEVPCHVAGLDGVPHELLALSELVNGLWARFLKRKRLFKGTRVVVFFTCQLVSRFSFNPSPKGKHFLNRGRGAAAQGHPPAIITSKLP